MITPDQYANLSGPQRRFVMSQHMMRLEVLASMDDALGICSQETSDEGELVLAMMQADLALNYPD